MIGKYFDNFIILVKGYKLKNYYDNEFFTIKDNKLILHTKAYALKDNKVLILKEGEYLLKDFKKIVITDHLDKERFINDLIYDNERFICLEQLHINFECKKFKTKYSSFKKAEDYIKQFLGEKEMEAVLLAFNELFMNAYEHGNLGLSFEEKERLIREDKYLDFLKKEVDKEIEVCVAQKDNYIFVMITDEGEGFEWRNRKCMFNGRGIKLCEKYVNLFYNKKGNSVLFIGKRNGLQTV